MINGMVIILFLEWNIETIIFYLKSLRGAVAFMLDCSMIVSEFELQSFYSIYFRANTLAKSMKPFSYVLNNTTVQFFYKDGFDIK